MLINLKTKNLELVKYFTPKQYYCKTLNSFVISLLFIKPLQSWLLFFELSRCTFSRLLVHVLFSVHLCL